MRGLLVVLSLFVCLWGHAQVFDITAYGAVGNGSTMNTAFIQAAIDSCHNNGGGVVRVPAGNFLTATLFLKSNVTILIDSGATITGAPNTSDYPDVFPSVRSYTDNYPQRSVFYAEGQHNIGITGSGTFNGNGISVSFLQNAANKPFGFRFISCTNVRYEGVTLRNSGFWMMHNMNIDTLVIKNVKIINQNLGNGDGLSIDGCRNVIIDSCTADCNDDPIVIKTTSPITCENVSISNCTVASYSRAIKIGTETSGAFRNIHISNITVQLSSTAAIAAKCGINLSVVDGGSMENVLVENINMTGIKVPIMIRLGNRGRKYTDTASTPGVGFLRNVELRNITATALTNVTSSITGIPGYRAANIRLRNVDITFPGGQPAVSNGFTVPENIAGGPEATIFGDTLPAAGLYMRHLDSMLLENVCFHSLQYDYRPTLVLDDVQSFDSTRVCLISAVISPDELLGGVVIYPNPLQSGNWQLKITENWKGATLSIFDISGRLVNKLIITEVLTEIPAVGFTSGLYLFSLAANGQQLNGRLIRQ